MGAGETPRRTASPERRETREQKEFDDFLVQKNLEEIHQGDKYSYEIDFPDMKVVDGRLSVRFGNEDISRFQNRVVAMLDELLNKAITKKDMEEAKAIIAKADPGNPESMREVLMQVFRNLMDKFEKNLSPAELKRFEGVMTLIAMTVNASRLTFKNGKPSLAELQKSYDTDFLPRWKRVEADLDKLIGG